MQKLYRVQSVDEFVVYGFFLSLELADDYCDYLATTSRNARIKIIEVEPNPELFSGIHECSLSMEKSESGDFPFSDFEIDKAYSLYLII